ncbi:hypothetical protein [Streptomyces anulatus]|uniref:hypothetical protein n=1 Tax=Streptomyces anulatus TaxID=1892 RepID=UPI0036DCD850
MWRSPFGSAEGRNFGAPQRYILGASEWRSPFGAAEDRNDPGIDETVTWYEWRSSFGEAEDRDMPAIESVIRGQRVAVAPSGRAEDRNMWSTHYG